MKRPISLWIFGIGGVVTNVIFTVFLYPLFYMLTQFYLFTWIVFLILAALFFPVLVISFIAMLMLRSWGRNIFVYMTLIINCFIILFSTVMILTSRMDDFLFLDIILIVFIILFMIYFLKPSTKALFGK